MAEISNAPAAAVPPASPFPLASNPVHSTALMAERDDTPAAPDVQRANGDASEATRAPGTVDPGRGVAACVDGAVVPLAVLRGVSR